MRLLALLMAAFAFLTEPASAQTQTLQQVVIQFDEETISRLLTDAQTTWEIEGDPQGLPLYRARAESGIAFTVSPRSCSAQDRCAGLLLIAVFTRSDGRSLAELDQLLNRYNDINPNGKAYRTPDGTVVLQGYINSVFGISYSNAKAQLASFGQEIVKLRQELVSFSKGR